MKQILSVIAVLLLSIFFSSCSVKPVPINYGKDQCTHCKMTIMDTKFGAQLVTSKGRTFLFDSDECLINYLKKNTTPENIYRFMVVTDYANPSTLIDAKSAFYLHGKNIQSPMGGNLASFAKEEEARKIQKNTGGDIIHWDSIFAVIH
jgi:copper chaperone NosL